MAALGRTPLGLAAERRPIGEETLVMSVQSTVDRDAVLNERDFYHLLMNIEEHPEFYPKAKELARKYLAQGAATMMALMGSEDGLSTPHHFAFFEYSPAALDARLGEIYKHLMGRYQMIKDAPTHPGAMERLTREHLIDQIRQFAPFNLVDGGWLQNIARAGSTSDVRAQLFAIWADESGGGQANLNHCNIYRALLESLNVDMPHEGSRSFVDQEQLLTSAFTTPVFALAVSLFPTTLLPELLGMTLYLEWESAPTLGATAATCQRLGIDPHFYELHVSIDNVASGHGAIARDVVKRYLGDISVTSGDSVMRDHWARIWAGYITFATVGTLGEDLAERWEREAKLTPQDRMVAIVRRKAPIAQTIHVGVSLTAVSVDGTSVQIEPLNQLFADPERLVRSLALGENRLVVPGNVEDSRFMRLLDFDGPMYGVFTDQEVSVIEAWIRSMSDQSTVAPVRSDAGMAMKQLLLVKAVRASRVPEHERRVLLPDGTDASLALLFADAGSRWRDLMSALADARNGLVVPGDPSKSRLVRLVTNSDMATFFSPAERITIAEWIEAGAPIPPEARAMAGVAMQAETASQPTNLLSEAAERLQDPERPKIKIWGQGSVN